MVKYNTESSYSNPLTGEVTNRDYYEQFELHKYIGPNKLGLVVDALVAGGFWYMATAYYTSSTRYDDYVFCWAVIAFLLIPWVPAAFLEWYVFIDFPEYDMPFVPWKLDWSYVGPDTQGIIISKRDQTEWDILSQYEKYKDLFAS